jgi:hypothetical protein
VYLASRPMPPAVAAAEHTSPGIVTHTHYDVCLVVSCSLCHNTDLSFGHGVPLIL